MIAFVAQCLEAIGVALSYAEQFPEASRVCGNCWSVSGGRCHDSLGSRSGCLVSDDDTCDHWRPLDPSTGQR